MFRDIRSFISKKISEIRAKPLKKHTPFIILLTALLILIPSIIALSYVYLFDGSDFFDLSKTYVELYDASGNTLASEEKLSTNDPDTYISNILFDLTSNLKNTSSVPGESAAQNYTVKVKVDEASTTYKCFFSPSSENSFIQKADGVFYKVDPTVYVKFLATSYAQALHANASHPVLSTVDGETVLPSGVSWKYSVEGGRMLDSVNHELGASDTVYRITGAIDISFDKKPTFAEAIVHDSSGEIIFQGSLEDLAYLPTEAGAAVKVFVTASWYKVENADAYGELTYEFNVICRNRAEFDISASRISAGGFIVINAQNIEDVSKLIYSPTLPDGYDVNNILNDSTDQFLYTYKPIFTKSGESCFAVIPFPSGTKAGVFEFTVSYGASSKTFPITVTEADGGSQKSINKTFNQMAGALTVEATSQFKITLESQNAYSSNLPLFSKGFDSPQANGFTEGYGFGDMLTSSDGIQLFTSDGVEYLTGSSENINVPSLCHGMVIIAERSDHLGNYVVVDHGGGLRTWYCNLSDITVAVGDAVAKGQTVGRSGSGPLISSNGFMLICSVYGTLIDPTTLF